MMTTQAALVGKRAGRKRRHGVTPATAWRVIGLLPAMATMATMATMAAMAAGATAKSQPPARALPHVTIDRADHYVDVDATVVSRKGKWMELLACTKGGRAYESVLSVDAKPSHIHLALLTLGLKPGKPLETERKGDHFVVHASHGPPVAVSIVLHENGHTKVVPANKWIVDQKNGNPLPTNRFLFTGSQFAPYKGKRVYVADVTGNVISLVNFGDEVLARDTTMTNRSDNQTWNVNTKLVPPVGTKVQIRLTPINKDGEGKKSPGDDARP